MKVENKKITVLGAARSGIAVARLLKENGANVFVSDSAPADSKKKEAEELDRLRIGFEFGKHSERIKLADMVVLSPGIPVASDSVQSILQAGIPVYSEIEAAFWFCKSPLIAVTGSNGKTTTTTLLGKMLKKQDNRSIVAGNIGEAFAGEVNKSIGEAWAAVEVSSFQLETIERFHPRIAVILNLAPNHLDRYPDYAAYVDAKMRVIMNLTEKDVIVFNGDDQLLAEKVAASPADKMAFSERRGSAAWCDGEKIVLRNKFEIPVEKIRLKGMHNYFNAMAASLAALEAGVGENHIRKVLQDFSGVEHRLEYVATINGIRFVNDSKATTVESLSVALQSFEGPVILIAGGKDKGSDFSRLNDLVQKHVRKAVLIGTAADKFEKAWNGIVPLEKSESLAAAVETAFESAGTGDTVLLSPACASFDMFSDFEERGRQFKEIVNNLKRERNG